MKILTWLFIFLLFPLSLCQAKYIASNDGRVVFETDDDWYLTSIGLQKPAVEILSVACDADTGLTLARHMYESEYSSYWEVPYSEKSKIMDRALRFFCNGLREKGFTVIVNRTDIFGDSIVMDFTLKRGGNVYKCVEIYGLRDYVLYSLQLVCSEHTKKKAFDVFSSLKIDGLPYRIWIAGY